VRLRGVAILSLFLAARPLGAQVGFGARLIPLVTHASPAMAGDDLTEGYLTQPVLMAHASVPGGRLAFSGMLNLEGATIDRGELNAGIWGEGYVDRRHPHTYLHELTATGWLAGDAAAALALSLSAGRGFAPFGTDDPMSRRFTKFPANHHLSQILERYFAVAALRIGRAAVEGSLFSGNEPTSPEDVAGLGRFGDSWAGRVTIFPAPAFELQGSLARVAAPDFPPEAESEHRKWSLSARVERGMPAGDGEYALVEWARTEELFSGEEANHFSTFLAEGTLTRRGVEVGARFERTTRPEEERLTDPFRTRIPHADVHLLGVTRWNIASARVSLARWDEGRLRARPFVELSRAAAEKVFATQFFDPTDFFGDDRVWNLSLGVRLEAGESHGRMGRYGAALAPALPGMEAHHH
jgi:hypothetical protein